MSIVCRLLVSIVILGSCLATAGDVGEQSTARPSSVTSESITTVDKRQFELSASGEILHDPATPLPTLANGHLGFAVYEDAVYLAGLYNGAGGLSHRARIPNMANVRLLLPSDLTLDLARGLFRSDFANDGRSFRLTHLLYPHALYRRVIVNQFTIERVGTNDENISLPMMPAPAFTSEDIQFQPISTHDARVHWSKSPAQPGDANVDPIYQSCGTTLQVENATYQNRGRSVCVLWNRVPERLVLGAGKRNVTYRFLMAVDGAEAIAQTEFETARALSDDALLESHTSLWRSFWARSDILITGNEPLQRTVRASLYYLVSNLPFEASFTVRSGPFWGLSPTGLGRGGTNLDDYEGHSFWDTEVWMFPVLNLIDPWYSRLLISYRTKMLPTAKRLAQEAGFRGARFPWESAFTGVEVTQPCCPAVAQYGHHITGDISFALRHYLGTTHDREGLRQLGGCEMAQQIAEFWSSRVRFNYTGSEQYDIPAVMGPDEDHENVTNNAYTNVVAGYALYFGEFARCICEADGRDDKGWSDIARHIKLPYDEIGDFHPQYDGYLASTVIKQADTVLIGYPLQYPGLKAYTRWNDLLIYEPVTRSTGPAMSWSMYAVNHLDIDNYREAAQNFNRSYQPYVRGPFRVWQELQGPAQHGAHNFLTGAGGFHAKHLEALNAEAWLQNIEKHANQKSPGHSTNRWRKGLCANPTTKHTTTTLYLRCNMHNRPYETASATQFCCAFLNNFFLYFSFDSSTPNQRVQKTNKPIMNTHTDTLLHRHTITLSTYKTTTTAAAAAATVRTEPHVDPARAQHKLTPINSKTTNPPYAIMANNSQTFWTG